MSKSTLNIAYYDKLTNSIGEKVIGVRDTIPACVMEETIGFEDVLNPTDIHVGLAILNKMHFQTCDGIKYLVLTLQIDTEDSAFIIDKWYPMNNGYNDELIELLAEVRMLHRGWKKNKPRDIESQIDFENLFDYEYDITYRKDCDKDYYHIISVKPQDNYRDNLSVFMNLKELFCDDNLSLLEEEEEDEEIIRYTNFSSVQS